MLTRCLKTLSAVLLAYLVFLLLGAVVPFLVHPKIRPETQAAFRRTSFCGFETGRERAALLWDNEDALAERIRLIAHARDRVILSTFEFRSDTAGRQVFLHTPYVICDRWLLERLGAVCRRTERTTLMTNSVANNGNQFGAMDYQVHRRDLLAAGLHILEYDSGISYHGKCAAIDDRLSIVGSFNYDMRSAYIDTELMLVLDSEEFCRVLREKMAEYEGNALPVGNAPAEPRGHSPAPQPISPQKQRKLRRTRLLLDWARFLM